MVGAGLHLTLLPLFLVKFVELTPAQIGLVMGAGGAVGLFAPYLAGYIGDRLSPLLVWRVSVGLRILGYAMFAFIDSLEAYVALSLVLIPLDRATGNAQMSYLISSFDPDQRNRTTAAVRACRNAGLSIGLLLASAFIAVGTKSAYQAAFLLNALSFTVLLWMLFRLPPVKRPVVEPDTDGAVAPPRNPWRDRRYLTLTLGDALMSIHVTVLFVIFPLWMEQQDNIPVELIGVLLALNSVATIALQPALADMGTGLSKAGRLIGVAGVCLVLCGALFVAADAVSATWAAILLVFGAITALTLGENLQEIAVFEASHRLAPDAGIGKYLGVFSLGDSSQRIVGPPLLTATLLTPVLPWVILMVLAGAGTRCIQKAIGDQSD